MLAADWASVRSNFHPNSACYDEHTGRVALMIQSRRAIELVSVEDGSRQGSVAIANYQHAVGVACDGADLYFTDYTSNSNGPDLFRVGRAGAPVQISQSNEAYGGYPLTIHGDTMWRTNDGERRYDWTPMTRIRVSAKATPDALTGEFDVAIPEGIGDLCHDGVSLWALGNVRQEAPAPNANLYRVDPATGAVLAAFPDFYQCRNGRPAGLACDGETGRGWIFCFNENNGQPGGLAQFALPGFEPPPPPGPDPLALPVHVQTVDLDAAWAGVHQNFHPQGACWDAATERVAVAIQSRQGIELVDPADGTREDGVRFPNGQFNNITGVACDGADFLFSDYTANRNGPDLLRTDRQANVQQVGDAIIAYGGFPLTVHGDLLWRGADSNAYDWRGLSSIRLSAKDDPENLDAVFADLPIDGIGDLCHDGEVLWALEYSHENGGGAAANLFGLDPATAEVLVAHPAFFECPRGRPSGLACDDATAKMWLLCFAEDADGALAEFDLGVVP